MSKLIGIDPATRTGWAYRGPEGWCVGTVAAVGPGSLREMVRVFRGAYDAGVRSAVVEDCFLGNNLNTLKRLAHIQGRVCSALEGCGITPRMVQPRSWKALMLRVAGFAVTGRDPQKLRALVVADRVGAVCRNNDEADAVCICLYGEATGVQGTLELREKARKRVKIQRGDAESAKGAERNQAS